MAIIWWRINRRRWWINLWIIVNKGHFILVRGNRCWACHLKVIAIVLSLKCLPYLCLALVAISFCVFGTLWLFLKFLEDWLFGSWILMRTFNEDGLIIALVYPLRKLLFLKILIMKVVSLFNFSWGSIVLRQNLSIGVCLSITIFSLFLRFIVHFLKPVYFPLLKRILIISFRGELIMKRTHCFLLKSPLDQVIILLLCERSLTFGIGCWLFLQVKQS